MNISTYYKLRIKQSALDFVDVVLNDDNLLFVDPRKIEGSTLRRDQPIKDCLNTFFGNLIISISSGNRVNALSLLSGIEEPKETRLGYGENSPNGKSAGAKIKLDLIDAIMNNPVIKSKKVSSISDMTFFIPNLGIDRISDITTKVIKQFLIKFTQAQCRKLGIPMKSVLQTGIFNPATLTWDSGHVDLPVYDHNGVDKPVIFIPKGFVSRSQDANSNFNCFFRFARNFVINSGNGKFVRNVPRNGKENSILAKDFDKTLGITKEELSKWVIEYPDLLSNYWLASFDKVKPLSDDEIEEIVYRK